VDPRAGLDKEDRGKNPLPLPGIEPRSPGRPVRSQTLYCLSYPAPIPLNTSLNTVCSDRNKMSRKHLFITVKVKLKVKLKLSHYTIQAPRGRGGIASTHS
jgi:hypothetical protein